MRTSQSTRIDVTKQLEALQEMSPKQLKAEWRRFYRSEPPVKMRRDLMIRAVAYKIQERAYGGLKGPVKRKLKAAVAIDKQSARSRPSPATRLQPGIRLVREWHGKRHEVEVLDNGFEYGGRSYRSLTAIAKEITGAHWSGPRFFGLNKAAKTSPKLVEACHD